MKARFFFFLLALLHFGACNDRGEKSASSQSTTIAAHTLVADTGSRDSIALLELTKAYYAWSESNGSNGDFNPFGRENDGMYKGIDWARHRLKLEDMRRSGLFSAAFMANYSKIASAIDSKLKDGALHWKAGDLPPFSNGTNPWCNCQDNPDNYLDKIWIMQLDFNPGAASFNWSWGDGLVYHVKAVKQMGKWQVQYLEGFDYEGFQDRLQNTDDFTGHWENGMVGLNIGDSSLAFEYHGQCVYFYPVRKVSDTVFEMIWARDMDCKFDNGTDERFGLKEVPVIGKPFARFTLRQGRLYADYYYKDWVKRYTAKVQDGVFTREYSWKKEQ